MKKIFVLILTLVFVFFFEVKAEALSGAYQAFPASSSNTVWVAYSNEGEDFTTIELVDSQTGLSLGVLGQYEESLNALGFHQSQAVVVGLKDDQFVDNFPVNNSPQLVVIDANGQEFVQGSLTAPSTTSTILSYIGTVGGDTYYTVSFRPVFTGGGLVPQYRLGKIDISGVSPPSANWSTILNFSSSSACQTHANAFMTELGGGTEPYSLFQDLTFNPNTGMINTVMIGNVTTGDLYVTIDPSTGAVTCQPLVGADIVGQAGGVAWSLGYLDLIFFNLEDGSYYKVNPTTREVSLLQQKSLNNLRGDLASNPTPNGFSYGSISGNLVDSAGIAISGSTITLSGTLEVGGIVINPVTVTTDQFGNYTFPNLFPGTYSIYQTNLTNYIDVSPTEIQNLGIIWGENLEDVDFVDAYQAPIDPIDPPDPVDPPIVPDPKTPIIGKSINNLEPTLSFTGGNIALTLSLSLVAGLILTANVLLARPIKKKD